MSSDSLYSVSVKPHTLLKAPQSSTTTKKKIADWCHEPNACFAVGSTCYTWGLMVTNQHQDSASVQLRIKKKHVGPI